MVKLAAFLTDYPNIVTVDAPLGSVNINQEVQIFIDDPCQGVTLTATDQGAPIEYRYSADSPRLDKTLTPFTVTPDVCSVAYTCTMTAGPGAVPDLCNILDGST